MMDQATSTQFHTELDAAIAESQMLIVRSQLGGEQSREFWLANRTIGRAVMIMFAMDYKPEDIAVLLGDMFDAALVELILSTHMTRMANHLPRYLTGLCNQLNHEININ